MKRSRFLILALAAHVSIAALATEASAQNCIDLGGINPNSHSQSFNGLGASPAPQASDSSNVFMLNPSGPRRYLGKFNNAIADAGGTVNVPGWAIVEEGTNASSVTGRYDAGNGSGAIANAYSFGSDADRALGSLNDDAVSVVYTGGCFTNTSIVTATSIQIGFTGEMWRRGASGSQTDRLDFEYAINATNLYSGTYVSANAFDFVTPNTTGSAGARNGNDSAYRTVVNLSTLSVTISPGQRLYIRWVDNNIAGADDGLAIDDATVQFFVPSSAPAEISGRVTGLRSEGTARVRVELQSLSGRSWTAITNPFGYYRFLNIPSGQTYVISVSGKGKVFDSPSRVFSLSEDITDVDFQAVSQSPL